MGNMNALVAYEVASLKHRERLDRCAARARARSRSARRSIWAALASGVAALALRIHLAAWAIG